MTKQPDFRFHKPGYTAVDWVAGAAVVASFLLWGITRFGVDPAQELTPADHQHRLGAHGGPISKFANDQLHAEVLLGANGELSMYTLGRDPSEVIEVENQDLFVELRDAQGQFLTATLRPVPNRGDSANRTSRFQTSVAADTLQAPVQITIDGLRIEGIRYHFGVVWNPKKDEPSMPENLPAAKHQELFLSPGGLYSADDIAANGNQTASQAFANFQANHNFQPLSGDRLCPITRTKANPSCKWIIGGKEYQFCCPPCIGEFVQLAKTSPEQIQDPDAYVKP